MKHKSHMPEGMHHKHHDVAHHMTYHNESVSPRQPHEGHGPSDMYSAPSINAWNEEMMDISCGKFGEKGCHHDAKKIAPYMMYNDSRDQNGY